MSSLALSLPATAKKSCTAESFRFLRDGKWVQEKAEFCPGAAPDRFVSKHCRELDAEACEIWTLVKEHEGKERIPAGRAGNPFFLLCHKIGGIPQEIERNGENVSRCIHKPSGSFVDLATMMSGLRAEP